MSSSSRTAALRARLNANLAEQRALRAEEADLRHEIELLEANEAAEAAASSAAAAAAEEEEDWSGAFPWDASVAALLSRFGHTSFRTLQREVINATLSSRDCFAVLPACAWRQSNPGLAAFTPLH